MMPYLKHCIGICDQVPMESDKNQNPRKSQRSRRDFPISGQQRWVYLLLL